MQVQLDPVFVSIYNTQFLSKEQKIHRVLVLLRSMRLSALDLVTKVIGERPEYKSWKDGLFKGKAFEFFFDALDRDKQGSKMMEAKVKAVGLSMTMTAINREMMAVKKLMKMSMKAMKVVNQGM